MPLFRGYKSRFRFRFRVAIENSSILHFWFVLGFCVCALIGAGSGGVWYRSRLRFRCRAAVEKGSKGVVCCHAPVLQLGPMLALVVEPKTYVVRGWDGTGAGSGSGCVACCIMLCSCCSGWYWVSVSAVPFGLRIFCCRFPSCASFFPDCCFLFPQVFLVTGVFLFPRLGISCSQIGVFCAQKGVWDSHKCLVFPAMVFFPPAREKFI